MTEHYISKHEKKYYTVWRVLTVTGPQEEFVVYGLDAAAEAVRDCYDAEVTDMQGNLIPESYYKKEG